MSPRDVRRIKEGYRHGYLIVWDQEGFDYATPQGLMTAAINGGKSRRRAGFDYIGGMGGGGTFQVLGPRVSSGKTPFMPAVTDVKTPRPNRYIMNMLRTTAAVIAIATLVSTSLSGQWPAFPAAGVPRTSDGKVDLNAPTPRTPDGKPDLSGVWAFFRQTPRVDVGVGGAGGTPLPDGTVPNNLGQFWDIAFGMKEPLPFQAWAAGLRQKRTADNNQDNPDAHCLPIGFMQLHTHPQPRKVVQTRSLIVIMWEANDGLRQIFLDGRPMPAVDRQPWWYGYSIGRWDGDALIVETSGLRDGGWLDVVGSPFTDAATVTERFRRLNVGNLEIDVTVDDPKAYTKPWTVTVKQRLMPDNELMEFICNENEKSSAHFVR